jgi:hypothetical protein
VSSARVMPTRRSRLLDCVARCSELGRRAGVVDALWDMDAAAAMDDGLALGGTTTGAASSSKDTYETAWVGAGRLCPKPIACVRDKPHRAGFFFVGPNLRADFASRIWVHVVSYTTLALCC